MAAGLAAIINSPAWADVLIERLLAESANTPVQPFERTVKVEQPGKPTTIRVDRYDPHAPPDQRWRLISINGREPTAPENKSYLQEVEKQPVPGFHRLHILLRGKPVRQQRDGVVVYHWPELQPHALGNNGPDISRNLAADAWVGESGGEPGILSVHVYAPKPFSVMMVARIRSVDTRNYYKRLKDGAPYLSEQVMLMDSNIPFRPAGITRTHTHIRPLNSAATGKNPVNTQGTDRHDSLQ